MQTPEELTARFRATGRKVTAQRQCVFRVLQGDESHPSAEAVHAAARRQVETISLKTVYQILHELVTVGEIDELEVGTGRLRFDANTERHHHMVCASCGDIRDIFLDPSQGPPAVSELEELVLAQAKSAGGFGAERVEVVVRGRCAPCLETPRPPAGAAEATRAQSRGRKER